MEETEDKPHDALAAADNGSLLDSPAHMAAIKDAIALHYVRKQRSPPRACSHLATGTGGVSGSLAD